MISRVPNRVCLRLTGPDTATFLQGMMTNNMSGLVTHRALYAGFLNAPGRVLYEALIYPYPDHKPGSDNVSINDVLVECDARAADGLNSHLKKFLLRSKVSISVDERWQVLANFGASTSSSSVTSSFEDPRHEKLGTRILVDKSVLSGFKDLAPSDKYLEHRYQLGIGEGVDDYPVGVLLPQESNLDLLNGIDYRKGCYVGQELVIRTHHKGVVRKRIFPVLLESDTGGSETGLEFEPMSDIMPQGSSEARKQRSVGKLISAHGKYGLALVRLESVCDQGLIVNGRNGLIHARVQTPALPMQPNNE